MPWSKRNTPRNTGWRDVSDDLINGWTGILFVRRVDDVVGYRGKLSAAAATAAGAWNIPTGFTVSPLVHDGQYDYGASLAWTEENSPKIRRLNYYANRLSVIGYSAADVIVVSDTYLTNAAMPQLANYPGRSA